MINAVIFKSNKGGKRQFQRAKQVSKNSIILEGVEIHINMYKTFFVKDNMCYFLCLAYP